MIWSVRQAGVETHFLGIVNERTYLEALAAADERYGRVFDHITFCHTNQTITLVVEPGETQRERRKDRR